MIEWCLSRDSFSPEFCGRYTPQLGVPTARLNQRGCGAAVRYCGERPRCCPPTPRPAGSSPRPAYGAAARALLLQCCWADLPARRRHPNSDPAPRLLLW